MYYDILRVTVNGVSRIIQIQYLIALMTIVPGQPTHPSVGCAPIPKDVTNFWEPIYTVKSTGLASRGAPVLPDPDLVSETFHDLPTFLISQ